jgi:hypothetical protein
MEVTSFDCCSLQIFRILMPFILSGKFTDRKDYLYEAGIYADLLVNNAFLRA